MSQSRSFPHEERMGYQNFSKITMVEARKLWCHRELGVLPFVHCWGDLVHDGTTFYEMYDDTVRKRLLCLGADCHPVCVNALINDKSVEHHWSWPSPTPAKFHWQLQHPLQSTRTTRSGATTLIWGRGMIQWHQTAERVALPYKQTWLTSTRASFKQALELIEALWNRQARTKMTVVTTCFFEIVFANEFEMLMSSRC